MNYYNEIKNELINNETYKKVKDYSKNRNDLETYYRVGKLIVDAQGGEARAKYGNHLIKEYSEKLTNEFGKKISETLLKNIRQYYLTKQKCPTVSDKLSWSHYVEIIWINDMIMLDYYINISIKQNLSVRELRDKIKSNEYERLDDDTKNKLINVIVNIKM